MFGRPYFLSRSIVEAPDLDRNDAFAPVACELHLLRSKRVVQVVLKRETDRVRRGCDRESWSHHTWPLEVSLHLLAATSSKVMSVSKVVACSCAGSLSSLSPDAQI